MEAKSDFESDILAKFGENCKIQGLHDYQRQVISKLLDGESVFVCQKTGKGKSLTYESFSTVKKSEDVIVLVVSPLKQLQEEQVKLLNGLEISAVQLGKDDIKDREALDGKCQYIYGSPEIFLGNEDWRNALKSEKFRKRVGLLVVDEAHLVIQWGERKEGETEIFRETYGRVGELRSLLPRVPVIALTATASKTTRIKVKDILNIRNCFEVVDNPDRENIKLFVKKVSATQDLKVTFNWLLSMLDMENCPRTLVFCKTINDTGRLYNMCRRARRGKHRNFEMFHSMTPEDVKDLISQDMSRSDGDVRVLFCTNAAGMGVNFKGVQSVVNYGPPKDMDTFLQHLGRASRDGTQGTHLLLFNGRQLRNVAPDMLVYSKTKSKCRRENLLASYNAEPSKNRILHLCCDNCTDDCACSDTCSADLMHPALTTTIADEDDEMKSVKYRNVSESDQGTIRIMLKDYRKVVTDGVFDELHHGITSEVIDQVMDNLHRIESAINVLEYVDIWNMKHATNIFDIISGVLSLPEIVEEDLYLEDD